MAERYKGSHINTEDNNGEKDRSEQDPFSVYYEGMKVLS